MKRLAFVFLLMTSDFAAAEGRLFGEGWLKCNEFLEDVETNFASVQFQMSWVNGYLSGRSLSEAQPMDSEKHNFLGILEYMKNYCEQNPSQHFAFGVEQLYVDMKLGT